MGTGTIENNMTRFHTLVKNLILFYYEGFREMPDWGKKVWLVILIKLFIIFFVLKIFFFQGPAVSNTGGNSEKSTYYRNQILNEDKK